MYRLQDLNGFTALLMASTAGLGIKHQAFKPLTNVTVKAGAISGSASYGMNAGIQYTINGKVDHRSAAISGVTGIFMPAYGLKGAIAVSSTSVYLDQLSQDKSLVDTAFSMSVSAIANSIGYAASYIFINNIRLDKTRSSFKSTSFMDRRSSFAESQELKNLIIKGSAVGTGTTETIGQGISKVITKDEN